MTTAANAGMGGAPAPPGSRSSSLASMLFRLGGLAVIDAFTIWLVYHFLGDGIWTMAVLFALVAILLNIVFLREELFPLRWISPGMALMIIIVIYPIFATVAISFSNFGDGHLLTQPQAVEQIEKLTVLPEDAQVLDWTAYLSDQGEYILWLENPETGQAYIARPGQPIEVAEGELPDEIEGYRQLD